MLALPTSWAAPFSKSTAGKRETEGVKMVEHRLEAIESAFHQLLRAIEQEIASCRQAGQAAGAAGRDQIASEFFNRASKLHSVLDSVRTAQRQWQRARRVAVRQERSRPSRRPSDGPLPRGTRTPESAFALPILETLAELGGAGRAAEVLDRVGERMRAVLKPVDRTPLPSNPREERWRNTARWARQDLVDDGLLDRASPYGIWQLTELGRRRLAEARVARAAETSGNPSRRPTES
jgi:hypothetical protein